MRDTERQRHTGRGRSRLPTESDVGLDPGTLGSLPEPRADAQPLSHPGVPLSFNLKYQYEFILYLPKKYVFPSSLD